MEYVEEQLAAATGVSRDRLSRLPRWAINLLWRQQCTIKDQGQQLQMGGAGVVTDVAVWGRGPALGIPAGYSHVRWLPDKVPIAGDDDIWPRTAIDVRKVDPEAGEALRLEVRRTGIGTGPLMLEGVSRNVVAVICPK